MSVWVGWTLSVAVVAAAWVRFGWQGAVVALTVVAFWLLLQFNGVVRVMRKAADAPVGYIDSAVMVQARLKKRMRLIDVVTLCGSLGVKVEDSSDKNTETWRWTDAGEARLDITLVSGRVTEWHIART